MRQVLFEFELELRALLSERTQNHEWGRCFLSPGLPRVWDANWILIEREGIAAAEVAMLAEQALAGFDHRTVVVADEEDGRRLAGEIVSLPGWEVDRTVYMAFEGEPRAPDQEVVETPLDGFLDLRRDLIHSWLADSEAEEGTVEQLIEWNRRYGEIAGDRWFLAPAERAASACCLMARDGIGQVENVGTLTAARGRGFAKAVALAALSASRADGNRITFLAADADDWPRLMYEKLGFVPCGDLTNLRRLPT
jgi:ribosomal protein S18 acetylase RimI-like enzyme